MAYNLDLNMREIADLVAIASSLNPERYAENGVKSIIYKCKALVAYQEGSKDYRYTINVKDF